MTTSKSPAAPPRSFRLPTVRDKVARMLAESLVAIPLTSDWACCTPESDWSTAARIFAPSSWSLICRNRTRLTITTITPATSMVIAPTRSCSDARQACTARRTRRALSSIVRRRKAANRGAPPAGAPEGWVAAPGSGPGPSAAHPATSGPSGRSSARSIAEGPVVVLTAGSGPARSWRTGLVADAADGQHDLRLLGVALDLGPQALDVHVDQPGVRGVPIAPDLLQQQLAGEHLPGLAGQRDEQVELEGGERDGHAVPGHLVRRDVDLHVADREGLRLAVLTTAQLRADPGDQ